MAGRLRCGYAVPELEQTLLRKRDEFAAGENQVIDEANVNQQQRAFDRAGQHLVRS